MARPFLVASQTGEMRKPSQSGGKDRRPICRSHGCLDDLDVVRTAVRRNVQVEQFQISGIWFDGYDANTLTVLVQDVEREEPDVRPEIENR
jgi:hypothetical protein